MIFKGVRKKLSQELFFQKNGVRYPYGRVVLNTFLLGVKCLAGLFLTCLLAPLSLVKPMEIWQMNRRLLKLSFFIEDLETGLRDLQLRGKSGRVWVIALYPAAFPNRYLASMYRRQITIIGPEQKWLAEVIRFVLPISRISRKLVMDRSDAKFEKWNQGRPSLSFTDDEIKCGVMLEKELGLKPNQRYICLAFQSARYRERVDEAQTFDLAKKMDLRSWIQEPKNYFPTIRFLNLQNIGVVRMGIFEEFKLPENLGLLTYDYANTHRSEFGDIWMASKCDFFLTAGAGAWWLGAMFGKQVLSTDQYNLAGTYGADDLFIPQLAQFTETGELANFEWLINNQWWAGDINRVNKEYLIKKNSPSQILDACEEMLMRINGQWTDTAEDIELQERFRHVQLGFHAGDRKPARIGAKFLREHQHLLPD